MVVGLQFAFVATVSNEHIRWSFKMLCFYLIPIRNILKNGKIKVNNVHIMNISYLMFLAITFDAPYIFPLRKSSI